MLDYQSITHSFADWPSYRAVGLDDLRNNLLHGVRDTRCQVCWQHEDAGAPSHRQRHNEIFHDDLERILRDPSKAADQPLKMLHLDFDNLCNLRCIMCSPMFSSSIQTEIWANQDQWAPFHPYEARMIQPWHEHPLFDRLLEQMSTVEEIFITGGEPLMNPGTLRMLDSVDLSRKTLTVTTNATVMNDRILDLLSRARYLHVMVSLEGTGAHNDYIRFGSDWRDIVRNINRLKTLKNFKYPTMGINHTLQITSAWTLIDLITWCREQDLSMTINPLVNPKRLRAAGMPDQWRQNLLNRLVGLADDFDPNDRKILPWVKSTISYLEQIEEDSEITKMFWAYVSMLDQLRGTNFRDTFGALAPLT
jgi:MoaA/NifB/PqqE/SkfB family radical SAM enzyme